MSQLLMQPFLIVMRERLQVATTDIRDKNFLMFLGKRVGQRNQDFLAVTGDKDDCPDIAAGYLGRFGKVDLPEIG